MVMTNEPRERTKHPSNGEPDDRALKEATTPTPERSFGVGLIAGLAIAVAITLFIVQNTQSVSFEWAVFDFSMPLWIALLGSFLLGLIAAPIAWYEWHRLRGRRERRRKATERLRSAVRRR